MFSAENGVQGQVLIRTRETLGLSPTLQRKKSIAQVLHYHHSRIKPFFLKKIIMVPYLTSSFILQCNSVNLHYSDYTYILERLCLLLSLKWE